MSLSGAISSALSGLTANTRAADVVAQNLANALTPGYAPRSAELAVQGIGGGVQVVQILRNISPGLLTARRQADSAQAATQTRADALSAIETAIGLPGESGSLSTAMADFETGLINAGNRPEDETRLNALLQSGSDLTSKINAIAGRLDTMRSQADADIAQTVDSVNSGLSDIRDLNTQIVEARASGRDTAALEDTRQARIDTLASIVPLQEVPRTGGAVALMTTGGAVLLDGRAAQLGFTPTRIVTAADSQIGGQLSGLTVDRQSVRTGSDGPLGGGKLGALFDLRDSLLPDMISSLDELAGDLIQRVSQPAVDQTLVPGTPGLFTDAGNALNPNDITGLAGRLAVNGAVDTSQGGALFRLRDGLGASQPGPAGEGSLLQRLSDALLQPRAINPQNPPRSAAAQVDAFLSRVGQGKLSADNRLSTATAERDTLHQQELERGVDSNGEIQRLMQIEQAFGANARMMQTIDDMMKTLLRI